MPPVLLIHLKRFSIAGSFTDKLETPVEYPVKALDLTSYMPPTLPGSDHHRTLPATDPRRQEPPYRYDLYGVTNHFGSLSSGHCEFKTTCTAR
jgi:ubiquitin carboxyl-terminal hydrolase 8